MSDASSAEILDFFAISFFLFGGGGACACTRSGEVSRDSSRRESPEEDGPTEDDMSVLVVYSPIMRTSGHRTPVLSVCRLKGNVTGRV